jgi:hypothetical protein
MNPMSIVSRLTNLTSHPSIRSSQSA